MKILIPVDDSDHARAALDFVASRSTLLGQAPELHLINVQPSMSVRVSRAVGRDEVRAFQRAQAHDVLGPSLDRLTQAGIRARASYVVGSRPDAIGAAAVRLRADLIVMGSRGHSGLKGLLFGSMTNAVLAGCTKPLLVLRSAKPPRRDSLKVGIAIDGSRYGQAAVRWAIRHRDLFGAEPRIELIHVLDDPTAEPSPIDRLALRSTAAGELIGDDHPVADRFTGVLAGALKQCAKAGLQVTVVRLLGGNAGDVIAAQARKRQWDVIVMGSHGQGAFKSLVMGSVAMRVAARCDKPLLLIREPARSERG